MTKYTNINESPLKGYSSIPKKYGKWNGYQYMTNKHHTDGWRSFIKPAIDTKIEKYGDLQYDAKTDIVSIDVIPLSEQEILDRELSRLESLKDQKIQERMNEIIESSISELGEEEAAELAMFYPVWKEGESLINDDKRLDIDNNGDLSLWIVTDNHTSDSTNRPKDTPTFWRKCELTNLKGDE